MKGESVDVQEGSIAKGGEKYAMQYTSLSMMGVRIEEFLMYANHGWGSISYLIFIRVYQLWYESPRRRASWHGVGGLR